MAPFSSAAKYIIGPYFQEKVYDWPHFSGLVYKRPHFSDASRIFCSDIFQGGLFALYSMNWLQYLSNYQQ